MSLYNELKTSVKEGDVDRIYKKFFEVSIDGEMPLISQHKISVDGLLKMQNFTMLLEFKYDKDFTKRSEQIEVIIQVLYYLKRFEESGESLPDICFVGDKNECFCFHSNSISGHLNLNIDWNLAPSSAGKENKELFKLLYDDDKINPFVHELNDDFNLKKEILENGIKLSKGIIQKKKITEKNINNIFWNFNRVIRKENFKKYSPNELVNIFITSIFNKNDNYIHPSKSNILITKSYGNVKIIGKDFKSFLNHVEKNYSLKERDKLTSICDRLIEDNTRRFQGEFFTPTEWVDEAHRMIEKEFGDNWKEEYIVWDPACGTGNLTRDYKFKELYCSTLNQSDLDIMDQMKYNSEATKFQFDFLNDSDKNLPEGLQNALKENKPIIILMNPPYGAGGNVNNTAPNKKSIHKAKKGICNTKIGAIMRAVKMGSASGQLYTQFFYKIQILKQKYNLSNINITIFTPPIFLSTISFKIFRKTFLNEFKYKTGMLFDSGNFGKDVSNGWGISFSIWKTGITQNKTDFIYDMKEVNQDSIINILSTKTIYNLDNLDNLDNILTPWLKKELLDKKKNVLRPELRGKFKVTDKGTLKTYQNSLGFLHNNINRVGGNNRWVGLYSSILHSGISVIPENFSKSISTFCAKKTFNSTWINETKEYLAPNTEHPDYEQWNNDCLVYSLFNNSSNQSSLRDITYKGRKWDIQNEWFWMSKDQIQTLAENHCINEIEQDIKDFNKERFVYNKLQETSLSGDAQEVLDKAIELTEKSFEYRQMMIEEYPEYHLESWDTGWYQIKKILKKYMPEELKAFNVLYKKFEDRMREGVYKFGFLK